jgi:hypothetical protein
MTWSARSLMGKTVAYAGLCAALIGTSTSITEAAYSRHGDDYSYDYADRRRIAACDVEHDKNPVKAGWAYGDDMGEQRSVHDGDGAGNGCATAAAPMKIHKHHTCEKNHVVWDCGNWKAT